jgi:predicted TIM-barrel fold metal-dependent hydrolase
MFSTDYPHRHTDEGLRAVPAELPEQTTANVLSHTAKTHYRL